MKTAGEFKIKNPTPENPNSYVTNFVFVHFGNHIKYGININVYYYS